MSTAPKNALAQLTQAMQAWETLRQTKSFTGMTLAQFKAKLQPSLTARANQAVIEAQMTAALDQRDNTDKISAAIVLLVVNAVKGDPEEGKDGELFYEVFSKGGD